MISINASNAYAQSSRGEEEDHSDQSVSTSKQDKPKRKRGRPGFCPLDAKIVILKPDARRKGTEAGRRFALLHDGMSVQDALDRGVSWSNLREDCRRGNISVT